MAEQKLEILLASDEVISKIAQIIRETQKADEATKEWGKNSKGALEGVSKNTDEYFKSLSKVKKAIDEADKTTSSYEEELEELNKIYKSLSKSQKEYVKSGKDLKELQKQVKAVGDRIKEVKAEQDKLSGGNSISNFAQKAQTAFKAFLALEIVGRIKDIAVEIAAVVKETDNLRRAVSGLTGQTGEQLDQNTAKIIALAETFNTDFNEVLIAVNARAKQTGETFEQSLTATREAFVRGKVDVEEYTEIVKEYSTFLSRAGLEGEAFNEVLESGFQNSNISDRVFATLEEGSLRLGEFTKATSDALDLAFGQEYTRTLKKNIDDNKITIFEALQDVSKQINETDLSPQQISTLLTDVFGGAGEGTLEYIKTLKDLDGELDTLTETQADYAQQQETTLINNERLAQANVELANIFGDFVRFVENAFTTIKGIGAFAFIEIFNTIKNELTPAFDRLITSVSQILGIFNSVGNATTLLDGIWNLLIQTVRILAVGISRIVDVVNLVIEGFIFAYEEIDFFRSGVDGLVSSITILYDAFANLPKIIEGAVNVSQLIFNQFREAISESVILIADSFDALLEFDFDRAIGNASAIKDAFGNIGEGAGDEFQKAFIDKLEETVAEKAKAEDSAPSPSLRKSLGLSPEQIKEAEQAAKEAAKVAEKRKQELVKIEQDLNKQLIDLRKQVEQTEIDNLEDGEAKFARIKEQNEKEIAALEANLREQQETLLSEGQITTERFAELEQQRASIIQALRAENHREYLEQLKEFNEAENEQLKKNLTESQQTELELIDRNFELKKSRIQSAKGFLNEEAKVTKDGRAKLLELDLEYLETKILFYEQLDKFERDALGLNEQQIETLTNSLKAQVQAVKGEIGTLLEGDDKALNFDLLEFIGIKDEKYKGAIKEIGSIFGDIISSGVEQQLQNTQIVIDEIDKQLEAERAKLEEHKELEEEGLAFNVEAEQEKIDELEKQREKALKDREKAEKKQRAIDTAQQISSLITTGANLFNSLSVLPLGTGVIAAITAIGTMYAAFNAFKAKATAEIPKYRLGIDDVPATGSRGKDSVLSYLMPHEAVLPVDVATENRTLVKGLLNKDKLKILEGVHTLMENYNLSPIFNQELPTFDVPDFSPVIYSYESNKIKEKEETTKQLAKYIVEIQSKEMKRVADNTEQLVKQGNKTITVLPEKGTVIEQNGSVINRTNIKKETEEEKLLKLILQEMRKSK